VPIMTLQIKFTEAERALLRKLAAKNKLSEADYLRVCMIMDGVMDGDRDAIKITAGRIREKVGRKVAGLLGFDFKNAPVKA
jgi:hypothetical protein